MTKLKIYFSLVFSFLFFINCSYSDNIQFSYRKVPDKLIINESISGLNRQGYKDITSYLPKNYSKRGNVDYTSYIQNALDKEKRIIMPNFPILVNAGGLSVHSNTSIIFQTNSNIIIQPNNKTNYGIINIINKSNVNLYNVRVTGDKYKHLGNTGEWGMGLNIIGSKNIEIINPNVTQCWGDGIYIGTRGVLPENITISGGIVDDNRRNGITIISGKDITIKNIVLSNTNGTLPMAGIDLEPNKANESLNNVNMIDITSYNNAKYGYAINLTKLLSNSTQNTTINLLKCTNYYSPNSVIIPGLNDNYIGSIKKIHGLIKIFDFKSYDSKRAIDMTVGHYNYTPNITVDNFQIFNNDLRNEAKEREVLNWMRSKNFLVD